MLSSCISTQKVTIAGTLVNPQQFKLKFETLNALLSLFDLQEKINSELVALEGSGSATADEGNSALTDMQVLLENVIQDSCSYVSQS